MTVEVIASAPAKLNLFLEVLGRRSDGFHELVSVMQTLELADTLTFALRIDGAVRLICDDPSLPTDTRNLVVRAARLLAEASPRLVGGVDIGLRKVIPCGGGLGGGSSDAATTLRTLNNLWECGFTDRELAALGAQLGSDVPFFLSAPYALCEGRGEVVTALSGAISFPVVLVLLGHEVATPKVYQSGHIDLTSPRQVHDFRNHPTPSADGWQPFNRLQEACFATYPAVARSFGIAEAAAEPFRGLLCGSGSTLAFLCDTDAEALGIQARLNAAFGGEEEVNVILTRTRASD